MLASARLEALATLDWALGFTTTFPAFDAGPAVELLEARENRRGAPTLRPPDDVERMRGLAGLWYWRSQTRGFHDGLFPLPQGVTLEQLDEAVREAAIGAVADGMIPATIDDDLPACGKSFARLTDAEWRHVNSTTVQRLFALNRLCSHAPGNDWDATRLAV